MVKSRSSIAETEPSGRVTFEIHIDLTGLEIGDSVHISNVTLPAGSTSAIDDRDFTIATLVAPSALKSQDDEAEGEGEEVDAGDVPATEQGEDADAAQEQADKSDDAKSE